MCEYVCVYSLVCMCYECVNMYICMCMYVCVYVLGSFAVDCLPFIERGMVVAIDGFANKQYVCMYVCIYTYVCVCVCVCVCCICV